ncbi:MAG: dephospho-CoA kinase [Bacillota bacterium]
MKVIGLTGSAGAGKTNVARHLKSLGAEVIEADAVAKQLTEPGQPLLNKIIEQFGPEYLLPDGSLNRVALRRLIFSDSAARNRLNALTHPEIAAVITGTLQELRQSPEPPMVVVVEAPLLLEAGQADKMDEIWVVIADKDAIVRRLAARDRIPPEQAQSIIAAQMPQEEKIRRSDCVIDNSGGFNHTREQIEFFYKKLLEEQGGGIDQE